MHKRSRTLQEISTAQNISTLDSKPSLQPSKFCSYRFNFRCIHFIFFENYFSLLFASSCKSSFLQKGDQLVLHSVKEVNCSAKAKTFENNLMRCRFLLITEGPRFEPWYAYRRFWVRLRVCDYPFDARSFSEKGNLIVSQHPSFAVLVLAQMVSLFHTKASRCYPGYSGTKPLVFHSGNEVNCTGKAVTLANASFMLKTEGPRFEPRYVYCGFWLRLKVCYYPFDARSFSEKENKIVSSQLHK